MVKFNTQSLAISAVVIAVVLVAYKLGVSQGERAGTADDKLATAVDTAAEAQPKKQPAAAPVRAEPKFSHFRVGNRNVKGMLADGRLVWVGTSGGVLRYDLDKDEYTLFDVAGGKLLSNGVFHLSKLDGKIAVGTYGGGLSLYDPASEQWKNYNIPDGLADQFVYDVQKVSSGDVWVATWSGVNRIKNGALDDPDQWQTFNLENTGSGLPNDWVYGLEEGPDGAMWFATEKGVARYKDGQWQNWQHDAGLGAPYESVKDDIKFSSDPGKASRHHAQQKVEQGLSDINIAYNPNYVVSLEIDAEGKVWGGTWGGGLALFDGKSWRNFTVKDGLPSNHVFLVYMDPQERLWVGTSHGLARLNDDGESFTVFTRRDGLFADNVFSMASASDGSLWVGSFGGVARLYGQF